MTDTPRRGRPKGATRHAKIDQDILAKVADLVTDAKPVLTPTAAMRQLGHHEASAHRRLQRKWRVGGAELQEKVRDRRRAASVPAASGHGGSSYGYHGLNSLTAAHSLSWISQFQADIGLQQGLGNLIDSPTSRMFHEIIEQQQRMRDMFDSPLLRTLG